MWEQRYGFPEPARTASGYRVYTDEDVDPLRRVRAARRRAVRAGRARARRGPPPARPTGPRSSARSPAATSRSRAAAAQAHAAGDLARDRGRDAGPRRRPVVIGAFQSVRQLRGRRAPLRAARARRRRLRGVRRLRAPRERAGTRPRSRSRRGRRARQRVGGGDRRPGLRRVPARLGDPESQRDDHLPDRERRFEALWTLDPRVVRRPRSSAPRSPRAPARRSWASGSRSCCATARSPSRRPRRADLADEPDRRLPGLSEPGWTSAPMRAVSVKPSCSAVAEVRSQVMPLANGPRSTTGTTMLRPP